MHVESIYFLYGMFGKYEAEVELTGFQRLLIQKNVLLQYHSFYTAWLSNVKTEAFENRIHIIMLPFDHCLLGFYF